MPTVNAMMDEFYLHAGLVLALDATDGVMHNDYDAGYDTLTAEKMSDPAHGTLVFNADGSFTYQADTGYVGHDFFSYRLSDGASTSSTAVVTIHVQNETPEGTPDTCDVWSAAGISSGSANVLDNDSDADNDALTTVIDMTPFYADAFQFNSDGSFSYTPNITGPQGANFTDFFSYKLFDGTTYSQPITVTLKVTDTAVAKDDGYLIDSSGVLTVSAGDGVLKNEFNPMNGQLTVELVQGPETDIATVTLQPDGSFDVTPGPNFAGEAIFIYALSQAGVQLVTQGIARLLAEQVIRSAVGLRSVSFDTNALIVADNLSAFYDRPHWLDVNGNGVVDAADNDRQYPVSFTRNSRIGLSVAFEVTPALIPFWRSRAGQILVRAQSQVMAPNLQLQFGFNQNIPLWLNAQNQLYTPIHFLMDNQLPNYADYYETLNLTWEISPDNGVTWLSPAVANTSKNQTFVTLANPTGWDPTGLISILGPLGPILGFPDKPYISHTLLSAPSAEVHGSANENSLVTNVFSEFGFLNIKRADDVNLQYWGRRWDNGNSERVGNTWTGHDAMNRPIVTTDGLLQNGNGQCNSWARLFIDVLRAYGYSSLDYHNVKQISTGFSEQVPNIGLAVEQFLIKSWTFSNAANIPANLNNDVVRTYTHYNKVAGLPANSQFQWGPNPSVTYTQGTPAQDNPTPPGFFGNHQVALINGLVYDPSYGTSYAYDAMNPTQGFANAALDGLALPMVFNENTYGDLDGNGLLQTYNVVLFRRSIQDLRFRNA